MKEAFKIGPLSAAEGEKVSGFLPVANTDLEIPVTLINGAKDVVETAGAQTQEATEYLQLWREEGYSETWTSTQNAQQQTALLFSNRCRVRDEISHEVFHKSFNDQAFGFSDEWNWMYIYDSVTFVDEKGKEFTLFNRIG